MLLAQSATCRGFRGRAPEMNSHFASGLGFVGDWRLPSQFREEPDFSPSKQARPALFPPRRNPQHVSNPHFIVRRVPCPRLRGHVLSVARGTCFPAESSSQFRPSCVLRALRGASSESRGYAVLAPFEGRMHPKNMPTLAWAWHRWRRWRGAGYFFVGWASSPDPLSDERGRSSYEEPSPRRPARPWDQTKERV
jgi:hypothetical protein